LTFLLHTNPRPNYYYDRSLWAYYRCSYSRNISNDYLSHHITGVGTAGGGGENRKFRISRRRRRAGAHSYGTSFGRQRRRRRRRRRTRERYTQAPSPPLSPPTTVAAASAAWVRPGFRPKWYFVFNGKTINGQTKTMANARSHRHRLFFFRPLRRTPFILFTYKTHFFRSTASSY